MAKRPAISKEPETTPKSEEVENFERGLRKVLSVSKKDLDVEVERTKEERTNGNGTAH